MVNSEIKIKFLSHNYVYVLEIRKYTRHLLFRLSKIEGEIPFSFFVLRNASAICSVISRSKISFALIISFTVKFSELSNSFPHCYCCMVILKSSNVSSDSQALRYREVLHLTRTLQLRAVVANDTRCDTECRSLYPMCSIVSYSTLVICFLYLLFCIPEIWETPITIKRSNDF